MTRTTMIARLHTLVEESKNIQFHLKLLQLSGNFPEAEEFIKISQKDTKEYTYKLNYFENYDTIITKSDIEDLRAMEQLSKGIKTIIQSALDKAYKIA